MARGSGYPVWALVRVVTNRMVNTVMCGGYMNGAMWVNAPTWPSSRSETRTRGFPSGPLYDRRSAHPGVNQRPWCSCAKRFQKFTRK
jgi:hypothetical protein